MKQILSVFGTRPEAIKMAPVVQALQRRPELQSRVCVTAQHRQLLDSVLVSFNIGVDYDLDIMRSNQDLFDITGRVLDGMKNIIREMRPDLVLVHGDTTTAMTAALAAYYCRCPVGHVEAGLRTGNKFSPFPEEMNRKMIADLADLHFAPTAIAVEKLLGEGIARTAIHLTGNTAIDALRITALSHRTFPELASLYVDKKMILVTMHRRENFGMPLRAICNALTTFARERPDCHLVYPVHPNPNVADVARDLLSSCGNISLIEPVGYEEMAFLLQECRFLLTDSGGLQEEAPTFGRPVLVLRDTTERPEAIDAGCALLVGHDGERILSCMSQLSDQKSELYRRMASAINPFGDGYAADRIASISSQFVMESKVDAT